MDNDSENENTKKKVKGRLQAVAQIEEPEIEENEEQPKPVRLGKFQAIVQVSENSDEEEPEIEETTKVVVRRPIFTATVEYNKEEEKTPVGQFQLQVKDKKREENSEDKGQSELKLRQLKEAFSIFDFNQDGIIDKQDLKLTMVALGQEVDQSEIDKMMEEANEPLDFDAFVDLFGQQKLDLDPEDTLKEALSKWDINNSGLISESRLKQDLITWGDKFTKHEVELALEEAPIIEPGEKFVTEPMIDYKTFCTQLCSLRKNKKE